MDEKVPSVEFVSTGESSTEAIKLESVRSEDTLLSSDVLDALIK